VRFFCICNGKKSVYPGDKRKKKDGAVAREDFRGKENFPTKAFLPPNPHPFQKLFKKGKKGVLLVTVSVAKPSLLKEFLKSEGGQGG